MKYIFKCNNPKCKSYHKQFEVYQSMAEEHFADCEICHFPAQRVYSALPFQFGKADYNQDGSRDLNPDLPHVPEGTKYTHGWTPKD